MMEFTRPLQKAARASLCALCLLLGASVWAAEDLDLQVVSGQGDVYTLSVPARAMVLEKTTETADKAVAEDLTEPLDLPDAEEVVSLRLGDGTTFEIVLPRLRIDDGESSEVGAGLITLVTADGARISIELPGARAQAEAFADPADLETGDMAAAPDTVSIILPNRTRFGFAAPTRAAQEAPADEKPDRVGVGEDLTDIPDLNDPEGLILVLPGMQPIRIR